MAGTPGTWGGPGPRAAAAGGHPQGREAPAGSIAWAAPPAIRSSHGSREQLRYDYDYSEAELMQWVAKVSALAQQAKQTYLFFNNCHAGQAARNAKLMEELLRRSGQLL
jgi:uncharacterized protein YecE (DUF72 family)